jgi:transcriptional regulator GlxA family with amidase domain
VSHVLLPVFALVRRADLVEVIGAALSAKAAGAGSRTIAAVLGRPVETVRGWLRTFAGRAEALRAFFTVLLVDTGVDPVPPAQASSLFADAVSAVLGAVVAARSRWPRVGEVPVWWWACAASAGRLLAPSWP